MEILLHVGVALLLGILYKYGKLCGSYFVHIIIHKMDLPYRSICSEILLGVLQ
jgi:hypothetical protein